MLRGFSGVLRKRQGPCLWAPPCHAGILMTWFHGVGERGSEVGSEGPGFGPDLGLRSLGSWLVTVTTPALWAGEGGPAAAPACAVRSRVSRPPTAQSPELRGCGQAIDTIQSLTVSVGRHGAGGGASQAPRTHLGQLTPVFLRGGRKLPCWAPGQAPPATPSGRSAVSPPPKAPSLSRPRGRRKGEPSPSVCFLG